MPTFDYYWGTLAVLGAISFVLYLTIIATILRYRKNEDLQSSFFKLWISLGVADCLHFIHSYTLMRLPLLGIFHDFYATYDSGVMPVFAMWFTHYLFHTQLFGNLLFAVNRFTAVARMTKHEQIWTYGHRLILIVALQWVIPIITSAQVAREDATYAPLDNMSLLLTVPPSDFVVNSIIASVVAVLAMVFCAIFYIIAIMRYISYKENISSVSLKKKSRAEMRLLAAAILVFICMAAYSVYEVCVGVFSFLQEETIVNVIIAQWYLINDVFAMINPWSLLLTCSVIRKYLLCMIGIKSEQSSFTVMQSGIINDQRNVSISINPPQIIVMHASI